jgi:hypothetical protein
MKKLVSFAAGIACILGVGATQQMNAQVYSDYKLELRNNKPFVGLDAKNNPFVSVKQASDFWVMPTRTKRDKDDGYVEVKFNQNFRFNFNGVSYDRMFVSVNGFITFSMPPNVLAKDPKALFSIENSYADNVIAPYWGDHVYRTQEEVDLITSKDPTANKWAVSQVLVSNEDTMVVVEWKNLNILDTNYATGTASVATFQAILYRNGDFEFAYGTAGKRPDQDTKDNRVKTTGAAVGIKGESGTIHSKADYMNALMFDTPNDINKIISTESYSTQWQPSTGSDKRIAFIHKDRTENYTSWGDGDADMSKTGNGKHLGLPQNRFVTVNDARVIMRSIATKMPLDSVKGRAAFHGDVNHNGRYIYKTDGTKYSIKNQSAEYNQDLPLDLIGSDKQLMFEVTEYDAAMIMQYLGGRTTKLPWIYDTTIQYGKIESRTIANNVVFGSPESRNDGSYRMPIYINGDFNGAIAAKFEINGKILNIEPISNDIATSSEENVAVLAADSKFNNGEALCFVTFVPNGEEINVNNIRFNDEEKSNVNFKMYNTENNKDVNNMNYPNPFNIDTKININIEEDGFYSLNVYDAQGVAVKNISNGYLKKGINSFSWLGEDESGNKLGSGMYIYRLSGNGVNITNTMIIVR